MKVLLVDNKTVRLTELYSLLAGHEIAAVSPENIIEAHTNKFDLIVLSGSSVNSVVNNERLYNAEKELILHTTTPVIGICLGFELIARVYGATIKKNKTKIKGWFKIQTVINDDIFGGKTEFEVYESHRWVVSELPLTLTGLAKSETGWEILRHADKPIFAMQFHPEVLTGKRHDGMYLFHTIINKIIHK